MSVRTTLLDVIQKASGNLQTVWAEDPRPMVSPTSKALITLSIHMGDEKGWEYERHYIPAQGQTPGHNDFNLGITNTYVLNVRVEQFANSPGNKAWELANFIRRKCYRDDLHKELLAANIYFADYGSVTNLPTTYDTQVISCAYFEIQCWAVEADADPLLDRSEGDWIDTVNTDNVVPGTVTPE